MARLQEIKNIEINYIRDAIPQLLYKKLVVLDFIVINDILRTSVQTFAKRKGIGKKNVTLFKNIQFDLIKNPNKYHDIYLKNKEPILPQEINQDSNFVENIKLFITEYKNISPAKRNIDVILKKYGLGTDEFTLEEIGTFYNLTRERIRQIKNSEIQNIINLFTGITIVKPYCKCNTIFISQIKNVLSVIDDKTKISYKILHSLLNKNFNYRINAEDINYISFFLSVFGFDSLEYLKNNIYFKADKYSNDTLNQLLNTIRKILEINIYPLDTFSIVVKVKKVLKNSFITNIEILSTLDQVIEYEKIILNDKTYYQLRIDYLSSAGDMGMRILNENKQSMHFNDLVRIINQKLIKNNSNKLVTPESLKAQFITSSDTIASGKTGYWSLKEWEVDTNTILSLIKSALISYNKPLSYTEIIEYILTKRSEIKKESIRSIVSVYKNDFAKLSNNKIILKEWSNEYKAELSDNKYIRNSYDMQIMNQILQIFNDNSANSLDSMFLRKELGKSGLIFKDSTYRSKFKKCPILENSNQYSRKVQLKKNHKIIMERFNALIEKPSKTDHIKKEIFSILKKNNNMLKQSKLVKILVKEFGFSRGSVYNIFQTDNTFRKQFDDNLHTYISLNISENEKSTFDNEVMILLQNEENDTLELKSSLRWDLIEKKINKDREYDVIKTIAAFLNSTGGDLLIGVDDEKNVLGLDADFKTFPKKNSDSFQLHLLNVIHSYFPKNIHIFLNISFPIINSKNICRIKVSRSDVPRFIKRNNKSVFIIRASGSSQHLEIDHAYNYIKSHWQKV